MSGFMDHFAKLCAERNYTAIIDSIPYARLMGVEFGEDDAGQLLFSLPFAEKNIGNPILPALHGGVIGGFMETAALVQLMWQRETLESPKVVDFSLDYLRSGKPATLYAKCELTKQGKRVANMAITAWQDDPAKPVAVARAHFLLRGAA